MKDVNRELRQLLIEQRERQYYHNTIEGEYRFYAAMQAGDVEKVRLSQSQGYLGELGVLSNNPLRNEQYHFAIGIGLATRFCIQGGMNPEEAYTLSDIYIQRADKLTSIEQIQALKDEAQLDFTARMRALQKRRIQSKPILLATECIEKHLTDEINVQKAAKALSLHPDYLSRTFRKTMGITMTDYIKKRRVEVSCHMLLESTVSCTQIASFLGFSSCSHYIESFKKFYTVTPQEYRLQNRFHAELEHPI